MIDDSFEAKFSLLCDEKVHFLADFERRGGVLNPAVNACRSCRSTLIV